MTIPQSYLAIALPLTNEDGLPKVLATSRMITLMKLAAARMMQVQCMPEALSLNLGIHIMHTAATPIGKAVKALVTFNKQEGRLYHFRIAACVKGGMTAKGELTKAIVYTERLIANAHKRSGKALKKIIYDETI